MAPKGSRNVSWCRRIRRPSSKPPAVTDPTTAKMISARAQLLSEKNTSLRWLGRSRLWRPGGRVRRSRRLGVGGVVLGEQRLLALHLREPEEDDHGAEQHGDDAREVGPLVAVEEGCLRGGGDLGGVLRVLLRDRLGAGERLRQLVLDARRVTCAARTPLIAAAAAAA